MKIIFSNREQFEASVEVVFHYNTRCDSAGDLHTDYVDMTYSFADASHGQRAVKRLKERNLTAFTTP